MTKKGRNIQLGNGFVDLVVYLHGFGARRLEVCRTVIYCMCIFHGNLFICLFFFSKNHLCLVAKRLWPVGERGKIFWIKK